MKRRFNTTGPCIPSMHHMIPAERRLPEAPGLVDQFGYFVVHAPRQTGKTTALRALVQRLAALDTYAAVFLSCEGGQAAGDDFDAAEQIVVSRIVDREYGIGRGRIDLLVRWPLRDGGERAWQREALELISRTAAGSSAGRRSGTRQRRARRTS